MDLHHWPIIAGYQVPPAKLAKLPLPPPETPIALLSSIQAYASVLFKIEADHYKEIRKETNYAPWLGKLEQRVIARVFRTVAAIEQANAPATLAYHGLTDGEIRQELGAILWGIRSNYIWKDAGPQPQQRPIHNEVNPTPAVAIPPANSPESVRRSLVETYRNAFPESGIMDICWAAKQHYREWTRWLKGDLKDNSKPDRSFRHVLTSGKDAKQLRREIRPKNWK